MIGGVFGRWTVIGPADKRGYRKMWFCKCECGTEKEVFDQNLRYGRSLSCGCLSKDMSWTGHGEISGSYWTRLQHDAAHRKLDFKLSIEFGWEIFLKQQRLCALTGAPLAFATTTKEYWAKGTTASLDRIDSSKPYTEDNVQWVHKDINKMKQNFKEDRFIDLCRQVVNHANKLTNS